MTRRTIIIFGPLFLGLIGLVALVLLRPDPNSTSIESKTSGQESLQNKKKQSKDISTQNPADSSSPSEPDHTETSGDVRPEDTSPRKTGKNNKKKDRSMPTAVIPSGTDLKPDEIKRLSEKANLLLTSESVEDRQKAIAILGKLIEQKGFTTDRFPGIRNRLLQAAEEEKSETLRMQAYRQLIDTQGWELDYERVIGSIRNVPGKRVREKAIEQYQLELSENAGGSLQGARFRLDHRGSIRRSLQNLRDRKNINTRAARETLKNRTEKLIQLMNQEIRRSTDPRKKIG